MRFGPVPLGQAEGALLAHGLRAGERVLRKGARLDRAALDHLAAAGVAEVVCARPEPGDVGEDEAAAALAAALAGEGLRAGPAATGRANLHATAAGLLLVDEARVGALNLVDEALTLATLASHRAASAGAIVATVKVIPFAVPGAVLARGLEAAGRGALRLAPFRPLRVAAVSTLAPTLKAAVVESTLRALRARLAPAGAALVGEERAAHEPGALAAALARAAAAADVVVVFGASAITDRRDVVPAAILAAGGRVDHLGMPVDPGNLLLVGALPRPGGGEAPVIGAPGCARSPRENGFDLVLRRLLAGLPAGRAQIAGMGVGGLLAEVPQRGRPRAGPAGEGGADGTTFPTGEGPEYASTAEDADAEDSDAENSDAAPFAAVVLAAGRGARMGAGEAPTKLLADFHGAPLVRRATEAALASRARPVIVVTGHRGEAVAAALEGLDVLVVPNPRHAEGLALSLRAGLAAVPAGAPGAVVLLGDMPLVTPALVDALVGAARARPAARAVVPVAGGRRGNPVLLARALFPAAARLTGDVGAKPLLEAAGAAVLELPVAGDGALLDADTPEALARLRARPFPPRGG